MEKTGHISDDDNNKLLLGYILPSIRKKWLCMVGGGNYGTIR